MAELYNKVGFIITLAITFTPLPELFPLSLSCFFQHHFHFLIRLFAFTFLHLWTSFLLSYQIFHFHFPASLFVTFTVLSNFSLSLSCFSYCCFHFPGWHWSDHLVPHLPWTLLRQVECCWSLWKWRRWQWCWWGRCWGGCSGLMVIDGDIIINSGKPDDQAALFTKLALKSGK